MSYGDALKMPGVCANLQEIRCISKEPTGIFVFARFIGAKTSAPANCGWFESHGWRAGVFDGNEPGFGPTVQLPERASMRGSAELPLRLQVWLF